MARTNFISQTVDYGRDLARAGIDGLRASEVITQNSATHFFKASAQRSLPAAALGGSLAFIACRLIDKRKLRLAPILACSTAAFLADFVVRTRGIGSKMIQCAEKEITKVRDQHWLESHPIDYA